MPTKFTKADIERLYVLVVDDHVHMRLLVKTVLRALGVRNIHESANGVEALEALQHLSADLLIADWMMTPIDGVELARHMRHAEDSPNRFLPIIMMTSYASRLNVENARDAGIDEFLVKPISASSLYQKLAAVIGDARLFVRTEAYFGLDRRRRTRGRPEERRQSEAELVARPQILP